MNIAQAVVEFLKVFGPTIIRLLDAGYKLIKTISDYFVFKKKREMDEIEATKKQKKEAQEWQYKKETANIAAFNAIVDAAWTRRHQDIAKKIKEEDFVGVMRVVNTYDHEEVNNILFDPSKGAEYKALQIVRIMKDLESHG